MPVLLSRWREPNSVAIPSGSTKACIEPGQLIPLEWLRQLSCTSICQQANRGYILSEIQKQVSSKDFSWDRKTHITAPDSGLACVTLRSCSIVDVDSRILWAMEAVLVLRYRLGARPASPREHVEGPQARVCRVSHARTPRVGSHCGIAAYHIPLSTLIPERWPTPS